MLIIHNEMWCMFSEKVGPTLCTEKPHVGESSMAYEMVAQTLGPGTSLNQRPWGSRAFPLELAPGFVLWSTGETHIGHREGRLLL